MWQHISFFFFLWYNYLNWRKVCNFLSYLIYRFYYDFGGSYNKTFNILVRNLYNVITRLRTRQKKLRIQRQNCPLSNLINVDRINSNYDVVTVILRVSAGPVLPSQNENWFRDNPLSFRIHLDPGDGISDSYGLG